jgi:GDP-L-fucose synthase
MQRNASIFVAGHRGLVGSALVRALRARGFDKLLLKTSLELDLRRQADVEAFFERERPEYVFLAAAKVGGIWANARHPAEFLYDNIAIATNVIQAAYHTGTKKLVNLGSSCIYPRLAEQPIRESALLTGPLESTNRAYAVAKIAAIELCDSYRTQYGADFISAMPTNLYGPNDNFDLESSHVLPAVLRKVLEAKEQGKPHVEVWGSGNPRREFLYVDDMADACLHLMEHFSEPGPINVGTGEDVSIRELVEMVADVVGYQGELKWDTSKPDGTPRKLLDVGRLKKAGWTAKVPLREGIVRTLTWYREHRDAK